MQSASNEVRRARPLLGTFVEIRAGGLEEKDGHHAVGLAFDVLAEVQRRMSFHDPMSMVALRHRGEAAWETNLPLLLKVHGAAAMFALIVLGALTPHVSRAWRANKNRLSGVLVIAVNGFLIATGYGLYYADDEELRAWLSRWHGWIGLGVAVVLPLHAMIGRRIIRDLHARKVTAVSGRAVAKS